MVKKQKKSHPNLGSAITATEFDLGCLERNKARIDSLRKKGVTIPAVEVDGTQIHRFFKRRFERIHWNCPFLGTSYEERNQLRDVVLPKFFASASRLQKPGDRIHVALAQENYSNPSVKGKIPYRYERQARYGIVRAATESRYRLIRKRHFDSERYPGYGHVQTGKDNEYPCEKREFVFEKVELKELEKLEVSKKRKSLLNRADILPEAKLLIDPNKKLYDVKPIKTIGGDQYYYECSTDEDSSDYERARKK